MRKLIVLTFVTLDGLMQEDPSDGFPYREWSLTEKGQEAPVLGTPGMKGLDNKSSLCDPPY